MNDLLRTITCFKLVAYASLALSGGYFFVFFLQFVGGLDAFGDMVTPKISTTRTVLQGGQFLAGGYFAVIVSLLEKRVKYLSCIRASLFMILFAPPMGIYCYLKLKKDEVKKLFK